jgi:putative membrane protein insertion efficiency factor
MVARALIFLIRIYQLTLSKLLGPVCRFHPSCSRYAAECLHLHGAVRGGWLAVRRLSRCHPFNPGGYDPPPLPVSKSSAPPT